MPERHWHALDTVLAAAPRADFRARLRQELERSIAMTTTEAPASLHTVTPYVTVDDVETLMTFAREAFGAEELHRTPTSGGGVHCLVGLGDALLMFVGGETAVGREHRAALHVYVPDVDATYRRALEAGATSLAAPMDKPYGARDSTVRDPAGNLWFIATRRPGVEPPVAMRTVTPFLAVNNALGLIEFLKQAFSATEVGVHVRPDGRLLHAALSIGDSVLEFGEADGVPPAAFYLFVPDADAVYEQALEAGARSLSAPANQAYGHRSGGVEDAWGNTWYIASHLR